MPPMIKSKSTRVRKFRCKRRAGRTTTSRPYRSSSIYDIKMSLYRQGAGLHLIITSIQVAIVAKKQAANTKRVCDSSSVKLLPDETAEALSQLAWAVAHPARVRIVRLLIGRTSCVCGEIVDEITLAQSTVSQHLKILKESGLIQGEVDGPRVCYCINRDKLEELKKLVAGLE